MKNEGRKTMQKTNYEDNNLLGSTLTQVSEQLDQWQAMYLENSDEAFLITKIASEYRSSPDDEKISDNEAINAIEELVVLEDKQLSKMMDEMTQIKINDTSINVYLYGVNDDGGDDLMCAGLEQGRSFSVSPKVKEAMKAVAKAKSHKENKLNKQRETRHKQDDDYDYS